MDIAIRSWIATILFFLSHTGLRLLNQVFDRLREKNDVELDLSGIDVNEYLNCENNCQQFNQNIKKNAKIKTVSLIIFKVCSNDQFANQAEFTAGVIFADCVMCSVKMLKKDCRKKCEGRINVKGYGVNDLEKVWVLPQIG